MKQVLPSQAFTQYQIICPNCGWKWYFIEAQLKHPKFLFVCDCAEAFKPRLTIEIKEKEISNTVNDIFSQVVDILRQNGWSKQESVERLEKVYSPQKDIKTLLTEAIFNV